MPRTKSPLRYPGGKTQLWEFVLFTIKNNEIDNPVYCEPFAGGAGIAWELLLSNNVSEVVVNDLDPAIFSFWNACLNNTDELIEMIEKVPVTIEEWYCQKEIYSKYGRDPDSLLGAFSTFFLNRTNISGVISGGPIGGKDQKGKYKIDCRFTKETSIRKIEDIASKKEKIHLYNLDATNLVPILKSNFSKKRLFTFFDPPYYQQGKNLYLSFYDEDEHEIMRDKIMEMEDYYWLLTYDKVDYINKLYASLSQAYEYSLLYSANKKREAKELLFASSVTKVKSAGKVTLSY